MKKYLVIITNTIDGKNFYVYVNTNNTEKAGEYGKSKLENEYPIYKGFCNVYNVVEQ